MKDLNSFIKKCEESSIPDEQINTEDVPKLTEEDFAKEHFKFDNLQFLEKHQTENNK